MSHSTQTNRYSDMTIPADSPLADMLYNSCGILDAEMVEQNGGYQQYHFEGHCVSFTIYARKVGREWIVRTMDLAE